MATATRKKSTKPKLRKDGTPCRSHGTLLVERSPEKQAAIDAGLVSPRGRPSGSKEKLPLKVREMLVGFLGNVLPDLMNRMDELELKEQWDVVGKILPYVTPKMISNDINGNIEIDSVGSSLSQLANESANINNNLN